ncbi:homoserine kinase [Nocardioides sp. Soil777]|uniref:homoserine kinase n=1 Tax=Nocardioides sp. Soil777 TaxID=1736409 RepID=UPI000702814D|nr:homoserine kinase [Nocardioides sp. Soil777]KRF00176.1 homoserine kinase [Nocardioides sp. Soil777]
MATYVDGPVRVTVPATSANLGPGFDALGLALSLRDELEAEVTASGIEVEVTGEGAADVPRDASHLVVRSMHAAFDAMDARPPGLRLTCRNVIPHSRGLGSSSAAIVAGVALARALVAGGRLLLDDAALLRIAADIEGHPDNVAPALLGGFVICGREAGEWYAVPSAVDPRVRAEVFVPSTPVATEVARGLLPATVPHADAAANSGRAALLVAALAGRPEHLLVATRDYLHQEQREPAMPDSLALVHRLRADGIPAVISGAGPTVLALVGAGRRDLTDLTPPGWTHHVLDVEARGVVVAD